MGSLKGRLLITSVAVLLVFVLVAGLALERAVRSGALQAQEDKMKGLVYALLGATEVDADGRASVDTSALRVPDLLYVASGVRAAILAGDGRVLWRSPSFLKTPVAPRRPLETGEWRFGRDDVSADGGDFRLLLGVDWTGEVSKARALVVLVTEDPAAFEQQLRSLRGALLGWLLLAAVSLLAVQGAVLLWGLRPLQLVSSQLGEIEAGHRERLGGDYPAELRPLTEGLNSLVDHEQRRQQRYRHALDDLAHSLKTPVAALGTVIQRADIPSESRVRMREQLGQVEEIIDHQLRKASAVGRQALTASVELRPLINRIVRALAKVYLHKDVQYEIQVHPSIRVRVDEGDLMEILGSLLDNASQWCRKRVRIAAIPNGGNRLDLLVDDDGPGFPLDRIDGIRHRGTRGDDRAPGQGIGLAVVHELVAVYEGGVDLAESPWGGARVRLSLP